MKIVTNTALIESRSKWAKRIAPLTMIFLIGGLITNFLSVNRPEFFRLTMILLALGFVFAIVSSHLVNHWVKEPRADQVLSQLLKKFGNDHLLFNYTAPVSHVLVAPGGVYVIVVKNHNGHITVNERRVSRKFTFSRIFRLLADEGIGAPVAEADKQVRKLTNYLHKNMEGQDLPQVKPVLFFSSNKNLELTVINPAIPSMSSKEFKTFFREEGKNRTVSAAQRKQLAELFDPA